MTRVGYLIIIQLQMKSTKTKIPLGYEDYLMLFLSSFNIYDRVLSIIAQDSLPERIIEQSSFSLHN